MTVESSASSLPKYLQVYCSEQDYSLYTPRDHAAWRYIMRQNRAFFQKHAVHIYLEGLKKTGIPINRIPRISDMDTCLGEFGWGAVPVSGFIPPSAFLDFQARRILPIATQMRRVENIAYTPAPDIVHEAAGHAPIIADKHYRQYLANYAAVAQKTIMSREDLEVYEAIRRLSDIKENPATSQAEIDQANIELDKAYSNLSFTSEATKVGRMAWWTVEYGLIQTAEELKIFGAGLLSSVGESQFCLSSQIKKVPMSLDCVNVGYDITKPQPQLFVAQSWEHLSAVLQEFSNTLSFTIGGKYGLDMAIRAETVNTVVLDTGVEISGYLKSYELDQNGHLTFIEYDGATQLSCEGEEIARRDPGTSRAGASSPLGRLHGQESALIQKHHTQTLGLGNVGDAVDLMYVSGYRVVGKLERMHWHHDHLMFLDISQAKCMTPQGTELDIVRNYRVAFGEKATSVYGGASSRDSFGDYDMGKASTNPGPTSLSDRDHWLGDIYQSVRSTRENVNSKFSTLEIKCKTVLEEFPTEWLLGLEIIEAAQQFFGKHPSDTPILKDIQNVVLANTDHNTTNRELIRRGLELLPVPD